MATYFVAYHVPNGSSPQIGNIEITVDDEIDTYTKVTEIEQAIARRLRPQGVNGIVVVTNWILLRRSTEQEN